MTSSLRLELPADPGSVSLARRAVSAVAKRLDCDVEAVRIAVTEVLGNCVLHAYPGRSDGSVVLLARVLRGRLVVTVADRGRGLAPRVGARGLGMGLPLVTKLAADLRISSDEHGAAVSMGFECRDAGAAVLAKSVDLQAELDRAREFLGRGRAPRFSPRRGRRPRPRTSGRRRSALPSSTE